MPMQYEDFPELHLDEQVPGHEVAITTRQRRGGLAQLFFKKMILCWVLVYFAVFPITDVFYFLWVGRGKGRGIRTDVQVFRNSRVVAEASG